MASEAPNTGIERTASSVAYRVGVASLITGILGITASAILRSSIAAGFAIGFSLGVLNTFWLLRIARKSVGMEAEKAGKLVTRSYYIRFALTAAVFGILIATGLLKPWPLIGGFTVSVFTAILVMILAAREEASQNA